MNKNNTSIIKNKIEKHINNFGIKKSYILDKFMEFALNPDINIAECSCRIEDEQIFANRFGIGYYLEKDDDPNRFLQLIINYFEDIFKIERMPFNKKIIINSLLGTPIKKIHAFGMGIDLRDRKDSRLKFYAIIKKHEKSGEILRMIDCYRGYEKLVKYDQITLGIDFFFDGRTAIKAYLNMELQDLNEIGEFHIPKAIDLARNTKKMVFALTNHNDLRVIYYPKKDKEIPIPSKAYNRVKEIISNEKIKSIHLLASEIEKDKISTINVYY